MPLPSISLVFGEVFSSDCNPTRILRVLCRYDGCDVSEDPLKKIVAHSLLQRAQELQKELQASTERCFCVLIDEAQGCEMLLLQARAVLSRTEKRPLLLVSISQPHAANQDSSQALVALATSHMAVDNSVKPPCDCLAWLLSIAEEAQLTGRTMDEELRLAFDWCLFGWFAAALARVPPVFD